MRALELPRLDHATAREVMLASLEFVPFPDVAPALSALRRPRAGGGEQLGLLAPGLAAEQRACWSTWTPW